MLFAASIAAILAAQTIAQDLPGKIRGYKVKRAAVSVNQPGSKSKLSVRFDFRNPELSSVSLTGLTLLLKGELLISGQSGNVDFISFRKFEVNGIKIEIEEFRDGFEFEKDKRMEIEPPIKLNVPFGQALKGAVNELKDSKDEWRVKGTVFVFGKFRKYGFKFKRVVPVDVDFLIPNPLKDD